MKPLWILKLVPERPGGRWLSGAMLVLFWLLLYRGIGWLGSTLGAPESLPELPVVLFFCTILAYLPPTFHYVTERTCNAFDELAASARLPADTLDQWRGKIRNKSARWVLINLVIGVSLWSLQSLVLTGGWQPMWSYLLGGPFQFAGAVAPLPVWIFMTCCLHALIDNARLFRDLSAQVPVDIHNTPALMPFGAMAVSSTLLIIGALALFPIMWLGGEISPWTTIPGVITTMLPMAYLISAPIWPVHRRLQQHKRAALRRAQVQINDHTASERTDIATLVPLLSYRHELQSIPDWPLDLGILSRLLFYLIIVPVTWVGAALIEILVDLSLAG